MSNILEHAEVAVAPNLREILLMVFQKCILHVTVFPPSDSPSTDLYL